MEHFASQAFREHFAELVEAIQVLTPVLAVCELFHGTRSMQGKFGASLLINIERTYYDLCVITKKEIHMRTQ